MSRRVPSSHSRRADVSTSGYLHVCCFGIDIGAVQQALNWLEDNQDKSLEELQAAQASAVDDQEGGPSIPSGESAKSLVCNDCGKKFRTRDEASFHAAKTYGSLTDSLVDLHS